MTHRYSTALSHLILAGTGIYCFSRYHGASFKLPCGTYIIIITNSILGLWRWGNPHYGSKIEKLYNFTSFLQTIGVLPFVVTQVWLQSNYRWELAYLHSGVSILPLTLYLTDKSKDETIDTIMAINVISLGMVSLTVENYYGIAASISYLLNHFVLKEGQFDFVDLPVLDLCNYGLCFYSYFALRALSYGASK